MKTRPVQPPGFIASILAVALSLVVFTSEVISAAESQADEEYFLIRTLEVLYEKWPQDVSDPEAFNAASSELRKEAIKLRIRAQRIGAAKEVVAAYSDYVDLLDSYSKFLNRLGVIRQTARDKADKENFESGVSGGYVAGGTFATISRNENVTNGEAALASLILGGVTYAVESWGKSNRRDEAERVAVSAAARRIQDSFTETLERAKQSFHSGSDRSRM